MSEIELIDDSPSLWHNLIGHRKDITSVSFNHDGSQIASGSEDNSVMLWNLTSEHKRCYKFTGHTDKVNDVQFSNDGRLVVSCSNDQFVQLWVPSITGGNTRFRAHTSPVNTVAFSQNNDKILTGSIDKSIKIWDTKTRRFISSCLGHTNWVKCARFSRDSSFIASCSDDKTTRIFDDRSGQCVQTFTCGKGNGNYLSIHHGSKTIAVAMNSGSVRLYDLRTNKLKQHYILHDNTTCVDWHPYANYLLTCGKDGALIIVDVMEGKPLYTLEGHRQGIKCVAFSKSGDNFASGGCDKHMLVWNTKFIKVKTDLTNSASSSSVSQESV